MLFFQFHILGSAAASWDVSNVDWVPTLNMGHSKFDMHSQAVKQAQRAERTGKRRKKIAEVIF